MLPFYAEEAVRMNTRLAVMLAAAVLAVIILVQNVHSVPFNLLFWSIHLPLVIWLLLFLVLGFGVGHFFNSRSRGIS